MAKTIITGLLALLGMAPGAPPSNDYAAAAARVRVTDLPAVSVPEMPLPTTEKPDPEKAKEKEKEKKKELEEQQKWHDHVKELASLRATWQELFQTIDRKTGLFTDKVSIEVALQQGPMIAIPRSSYTHSSQSGNLFANTTTLKGQDDGLIRAMFLSHLTKIMVGYHFNTGGLAANKKALLPEWFTEGLAGYAGYSEWPIVNRRLRIQKMSLSLRGDEASQRGRLFFEYVDGRGNDVLKEFVGAVVLRGLSLSDASETVFKTDWNKFLDAEKKWSENRILQK